MSLERATLEAKTGAVPPGATATIGDAGPVGVHPRQPESGLVQDAGQHLRIASLTLATGMALAFALTWLVTDVLQWSQPTSMIGLRVTHGGLLLVSLGVALLSRHPDIKPRLLLDIGLAYEVIGAFGLSLAVFFDNRGEMASMVAVPWLGVWLVMFPLLVPVPPLRSFMASVASGAMIAPALGIYVAMGYPMLSNRELGFIAVPIVVCIGLSLGPNLIVHQLGLSIREARQELRRLGAYRLTKLLGQGGMGEVWQAEHAMLARPAAIKLIKTDKIVDGTRRTRETAFARFEREAQATARLKSPHTIELYDFGQADDGVLYYVMEYLEGVDLDFLVRSFGPLGPARTAVILRQACRSLAEAHENGIIHRDIKPANIYLCRLGLDYDFVKLLDFGLVTKLRQADDPSDDRLTGEGYVMGTIATMAPEACEGNRKLDARVDIYALGCVAYWLLTGRLPFEDPSPMKILYLHVNEPAEPPSKYARQPIPPDLDKLILSALEKDPIRRPGSARAFSRLLDQCDLGDDTWSRTDADDWWRKNLPEHHPDEAAAAKGTQDATVIEPAPAAALAATAIEPPVVAADVAAPTEKVTKESETGGPAG